MMLNRDRDRERGMTLCWLFETKALVGMVLIPMLFLVSFAFESLPLPVPDSSFESRHPGFFFRMPGKVPHLYTLILKFPRVSIKQNEKPGGKQKKKGERKSRKWGRSLVLVLTKTSLSNFHFWVVSLLDWKKDKTSLSFNSFFFLSIPSTNFGYDQWPTSWIGVTKLPEKRQGAPWIEIDELRFARDIYFFFKILHWMKNGKI